MRSRHRAGRRSASASRASPSAIRQLPGVSPRRHAPLSRWARENDPDPAHSNRGNAAWRRDAPRRPEPPGARPLGQPDRLEDLGRRSGVPVPLVDQRIERANGRRRRGDSAATSRSNGTDAANLRPADDRWSARSRPRTRSPGRDIVARNAVGLIDDMIDTQPGRSTQLPFRRSGSDATHDDRRQDTTRNRQGRRPAGSQSPRLTNLRTDSQDRKRSS